MHELPKIIAVDLDGTVLNHEKIILPHTWEVLKACTERGSEVVPTTGRIESMTPLSLFPSVRYAITCNGGVISDLKTDQVIRTKSVSGDHLRLLWKIVGERMKRSDRIVELFEGKQVVFERKILDHLDKYAPRLPKFHLQYILDGNGKFVDSFDEYIETEGNPVTKVNCPGEGYEDCRKMREELNETGFFRISSDGLNLEVNAKDCSKGEALLWLSDYLGIPEDSTIAFGDGNNDISMLKSAGWGVAMGNAADEVKAEASYCTGTNEEEGVADFLEKMFKADFY